MPNGQLLANAVVNWTATDRHRRVDVEVGIAYGSDLRRVVSVLTETAQSLPDALDYPAAMTVFESFGESSINLSVRIWIWEHDQWPEAKTRLATAVVECLAREGIQIPLPQRVMHYGDKLEFGANPDAPASASEAQPGPSE